MHQQVISIEIRNQKLVPLFLRLEHMIKAKTPSNWMAKN
jgi:hypothetical protein